jgi:hypothetical protein
MNRYKRHRFPPDIISYAVWLYYRFNLSHRDIEDLLAERGITVSREAIRLWCIKFGAKYARRLKRKHRGYGDTVNTLQWTRGYARENFEFCLLGSPGAAIFWVAYPLMTHTGPHLVYLLKTNYL